MLTLTATKHADWQTHTISRAHIARYPGSLLASLCDAVQPDVACDVTLDLSASLGDSPLASWAPAAAITASIFRHEYIEPELLSEQLRSRTSYELVKQLQQLLDFLGLPGPLSHLVPAPAALALRQLRVKQLGAAALAQETVSVMMASLLLLNSTGLLAHSEPNAACFVISLGWPFTGPAKVPPQGLYVTGVPAAALMGRAAPQDGVTIPGATQCKLMNGAGSCEFESLLATQERLLDKDDLNFGAALGHYLTAALHDIPSSVSLGRVQWTQVAARCMILPGIVPVWIVHW